VADSSASATLAIALIRQLRSRGHKAFLVGGCVRDRLLGIEPKDFDISTDASPAQIGAYFAGTSLVGAHFGVVLVKDGAAQVEIATFRSEGEYTDARRPDEVRFESDPILDAQRRDFTINGLMEDPLTGEIIDAVGGRADLAHKTIRMIGDAGRRLREDHLRMLRAVRFAARLHFDIEPNTRQAIRQRAEQIKTVSAERVRDELARILSEGGARRGVEMLDEMGLLAQLLPEVKAFQGVEQPPEFHPEGDVWTHVLLMLENMGKATNSLALGVLLHDVGKPATFRRADRIRFDGHAEVGATIAWSILGRLRFSNEETGHITALVANHMKFKDVQKMRTSTLKRFLRMERFEEHLALHRLDCLASNGRMESYDFISQKLAQLGTETLHPPRLITGRDLIEAGYAAGPGFARALEAVETAQLEGEIHTRLEAMEIAGGILSNTSC
jgi:putative nucleotidyltransferase with HDIG domain